MREEMPITGFAFVRIVQPTSTTKAYEPRAQPVATANGPAGPWLISNVRQRMTTFRKVTLIVSGGFWFLMFAGFYFVIPVFAAMFADFGARLPLPTQYLIDTAGFFRVYPIVAAPIGIIVILVGAAIERRNSVMGLRLYFAVSLVTMLAVVLAMFLPIFQLGAVAGGMQK
jgi:type II secretory pathway component PulF